MTDNPARTAQGIAPGVRAVALTTILGLTSECVSVRVESLMQPHHPLRKGNEPVQGLSTELFRHSIKLACIVAMSLIVDEDALGERVLTRARRLGADAVILGKVGIREWGRVHRMNSRSARLAPGTTHTRGAVGIVGPILSI